MNKSKFIFPLLKSPCQRIQSKQISYLSLSSSETHNYKSHLLLQPVQKSSPYLNTTNSMSSGPHQHEPNANASTEDLTQDSSALNVDLNIHSLTNGDPVLERKLKVLLLEVEVLRQEGRNAPTASTIKHEHWKELLDTTSRSSRKKFLAYLWGIEMKKQTEKLRRGEKQQANAERFWNLPDDGHIRYGLNHNTIYMRIYDTTINQLLNNKLVQAIQFGQKFVVDCSYDSHMTNREALNAAKQVMLLFAENRNHKDPFDLHLCNANLGGPMFHQLHKFINTLYEDSFPLNVSTESYLKRFPKERLVYLTPHCREELMEFNHDDVYIIGAMVDKVNQEPLSLAKAKSEGLRMAKLPLDRHLSWGSGSGKSLTLNQMIAIMLEIKTSGDWREALKHVPRRKINHDEDGRNNMRYKHLQSRWDRSRY